MIEIRNIKGQLAELSPGTSISIEKHNPLFNDEDKLFEDITYSFKMPQTDNNKVFFSDGHLVETENNVYQMAIQCIVAGTPFYAGNLSFSVSSGEYDVLLLINFGSLATKVKTVKLSEIYTADALPGKYTAADMKLTCQNPQNYPYAFFPVFNDAWDPEKVTTTFLVNNWDHPTQTFINRGFTFHDHTVSSPYFKLKYILTKVMDYLGFTVSGSWMDDPEADKIYIYTRYGLDLYLFGSTSYMPRKLTIAEFFKICKSRFRISLSWNVFKGSVVVESGTSLLNEINEIDLSDYVASVDEISVPEADGFSLTLKPDEKDDLFLDPINVDEKNFIPSNRLVIGQGETKIEIDSSTLKVKLYPEYKVPQTRQMLWLSAYAGEETFPLRFIYFAGMKNVSGGKVFPEAVPLELDVQDASWFRFLNDSKKIKLSLFLPPTVLADLDTSKPIGFISEQGNYHTALIESIKYNLNNEDEEFISTVIECRTRIASFTTTVSIEDINTANSEDIASPKFKAFFEPGVIGVNQIDFELYYPLGRITDGAYAPLTSSGSIKKSTDMNGGGGEIVYLPVVYYDRATQGDIELRFKTATPKYLIQNGIKRTFTQGSGYSFIKALTFGGGFKAIDGLPIWIVF